MLFTFSEGAGGATRCPALAALDTRGDGMVLSVARRSAAVYESDPRDGLCRLVGALPETMVALAVRADGRLFTVSATNKLYRFDAQGRQLSAAVLLCPPSTPTCPVRGLDFSPAGTLHAIVAPGLWSRIDATSAQLTSIRTGVGLSDDFDIDAQGRVRGLAGDELRFFDLTGNPSGRAVNVFGGTAFATGLGGPGARSPSRRRVSRRNVWHSPPPMALKSTVFKAALQVADIDHAYYADHTVTLARHPSETDERLMVRLVALALQAHQVQTLAGGDASWGFGKGLSDPEDPDVVLTDYTGRRRVWVETGQPEDKPLAKACSRADLVVAYPFSSSAEIWWRGVEARLARLPRLEVWRLPAEATQALAGAVGRSMIWQATIQDGLLSLSGEAGHFDIEPQRWK